jgi:ATP-binding cassette subfamily B protein
VIVFDEGTSALDGATESAVIDALQSVRGGRTLITVAHRLSTVRACDRIAVIDGGRLVALGSHAEIQGDSTLLGDLTT